MAVAASCFPESVAILGAGVAGLAVAEALAARGVRVTVYDRLPAAELTDATARLRRIGAELRPDGDLEGLEEAGLIVPSPGAAVGNPLLEAARARGQRIIAEIDAAQRLLSSPMIAVTGTNGKTTTVLWIAAALEAGGIAATVAGNTLAGGYQLPLATAAASHDASSWIVAEISSFQLECAREFHPRIAAITNVTGDHLDRHGTLEAYAAAKRRLLQRLGPEDAALLNCQDPLSASWGEDTAATVYWIDSQGLPERGGGVERDALWLQLDGGRGRLCAVSDLRLPGRHSIENALMAALAARLAGATLAGIRAALRDFSGVPDRMEIIAEVNGVQFVNNSMCTNVAAAVRSLEAFERPVIAIVGGQDKGSDFEPLGRALRDRARAVISIGRDGDRIAVAALGAGLPEAAVSRAESLEEAVRRAAEAAEPGDAVALLPACASFDWFPSFQHRGEAFRQAVGRLQREEGK